MSTTSFIPEPEGRLDERIADAYRRMYGEARDPFEIRPMIEAQERSLEKPLRADARFLLFINFSAMIIQPVMMAEKLPIEEIRGAVERDLNTITLHAVSIAPANRDEVSGHQVIDALTQAWGELRTMAYNIWD